MRDVLFIAYKFFDEDPRIIREAAACLRAGKKVDVICVARKKKSIGAILPESINFFSPSIKRKRSTKVRYICEYLIFILYSVFKAAQLQVTERYKVVQIFVMPELLFVCGLIPKLLGAKILLDIEDPSIEVFQTKYPNSKSPFFPFLLKIIERCAISVSNVVITPNIGFKKAFCKRGLPGDKMHIVMNAPDLSLFDRKIEKSNLIDSSFFTILFNGTVFERHGLHVLIDGLALLKGYCEDFHAYIVGDGERKYMEQCKKRVEKNTLAKHVSFISRVPIEAMPSFIYSVNVGVVPNILTPFTEINFPQRILEFGLLKKPLVSARLSGITDYFNEDELFFFTPGDAEMLARQLLTVKNAGPETGKHIALFHEKCKSLGWEKEYIEIIKNLMREK